MKIAIISDTHSLLRPEILKILYTSDQILHAGDIASKEIFEQIRSIAPAHFVRGNADKAWAEDIPTEAEFQIEGLNFYMIHNIKHARKNLSEINFVIYGHSHKYEIRQNGNTTFLNPGSCGPRRFMQPVTMMLMTLECDGNYQIKKTELSPIIKHDTKYPPQKEMDILIKHIIKDMNANRTVEQISERNHIEKELVEEILQIYTTHPGIDISGILNRIKS